MSLCQRGVKAEAEGCGFPAGSGVKVFLHWSGDEDRERCRVYSQGSLSAEEICIDLSRRIGEGGLPVFQGIPGFPRARGVGESIYILPQG